MMKNSIAFFTALCLCGSIYAEEPSVVTFELSNNRKQSFQIEDVSVINYRNDSLFLEGKAATSYAFNDVKKYYFSESGLSVIPDVAEKELRIIYLDNENVELKGLEGQNEIFLFNALGQMIKRVSSKESNVRLELPIEKGVYILKVNDRSVKLTKD